MEKVKIYRDIAKLKDIDLFYMDTRTDGTVILCLHGRWGRAETWVDFMRQYGTRYRVIAPDQRGHGLSSKPISDYTGEELAEDVHELLDYLKLDSVIVAGHSMGGQVAGYFTARYPGYVKALAILDKSANGPEPKKLLPPDQIPAVDSVTKDWPMPFSSLQEASAYIRQVMESELSVQYFTNSLTETTDGYRMMYSNQAVAANAANYVNWFHLLPGIQCPVLLIRSNSHEAVPDEDFRKMQELLPDCLAFEVSHPDHNVQLGNKEEFYRYFDQFLERI